MALFAPLPPGQAWAAAAALKAGAGLAGVCPGPPPADVAEPVPGLTEEERWDAGVALIQAWGDPESAKR